jgi:hypothetical protein
MEYFIKEWASHNKLRIKRHQFIANSIDEIIEETKQYTKELCFDIKIIERTTHSGFYMKLHRDDYRFDNNAYKRGIKDESLWIPIYEKVNRPIYTVIWYQSTQGIDFIGGNLRFYDGQIVKPEKNVAILFDSNDIHEVTLQQTKNGLTDERKVKLIKFYQKK